MMVEFLKLKNFRGYFGTSQIEFENLTAFVGKNDVGKSTILEALDLFFYEGAPTGTVKYDAKDINIQAYEQGERSFSISVGFSDCPEQLVVDSSFETTLADEHMLNSDGILEVCKIFSPDGRPKIVTQIIANHPANLECSDLLLKKNSELKTILGEKDISCKDLRTNALMRRAIWDSFGDSLHYEERPIEVNKEDAKRIYEKLAKHFPVYALFQADRKNSDGDSEVQDPLKVAVKQILEEKNLQDLLRSVTEQVRMQLKDVANRTLEKLKEMNPGVAESLNPDIPDIDKLKWADVFKSVSIAGDNSIPINKRGSGTRRLILLNFFRAEAERLASKEVSEDGSDVGVVYAIEEPETSQHTANQRILIQAFKKMAKNPRTQIILTTHSPVVVKELELKDIRIVREERAPHVEAVRDGLLGTSSMSEINYLSYGDGSEEYHDELYALLETNKILKDFEAEQDKIRYQRPRKDGTATPEELSLSTYIRHQIHHPENKLNKHYTDQQLIESINKMREFLKKEN